MNKKELVNAIAATVEGMTKKDITLILDVTLEEIAKAISAGEKVKLSGFGSFEVVERAAREGRNPQNGEILKIAATKAPKFKAASALKAQVNA